MKEKNHHDSQERSAIGRLSLERREGPAVDRSGDVADVGSHGNTC